MGSGISSRRYVVTWAAVALAVGAGSMSLKRRHLGEAIFRSVLLALRSPRVFNITVTAAALTYLCRRVVRGSKMRSLFGLFFALVWSLYYRYFVRESPKLSYVRTLWNSMIVERARLQKMRFSPSFVMFNRHSQTIICLAMSSLEFLWDHSIEFTREDVPSFDTARNGSMQHLDWASYAGGAVEMEGSPRPVVVIVHGFGDNRYHPYSQRICRSASQAGWRCVVFSYWRFDFAETRDLRAVLEHVQSRNPLAPIVAVAYSAGGHLLLKYLQDAGKKTPLVAAISCSGCFDLENCVKNIAENENPTYLMYLNEQALVCARRHMDNDGAVKRSPALRRRLERVLDEERDCKRIYDRFLFSLPDYAYRNADCHARNPKYKFREQTKTHYQHFPGRNMNKVDITTLILHADDDPVVSNEHIDWTAARRNRNIITVRTRRGGHVAWYEGMLPFGETWCDRVVCRFISGVLETHSQTNFIVDVIRRMNASGIAPPGTLDSKRDRGGGKGQGGGLSGPAAIARICSASDIKDMRRF